LIDLKDALGGWDVAGGKMKTTGTLELGTGLWHDPNTDATNESGFSGLPGGTYTEPDTFNYHGYYEYFWYSHESSSLNAHFFGLDYFSPNLYIFSNPKVNGFAIRCVMEEE